MRATIHRVNSPRAAACPRPLVHEPAPGDQLAPLRDLGERLAARPSGRGRISAVVRSESGSPGVVWVVDLKGLPQPGSFLGAQAAQGHLKIRIVLGPVVLRLVEQLYLGCQVRDVTRVRSAARCTP